MQFENRILYYIFLHMSSEFKNFFDIQICDCKNLLKKLEMKICFMQLVYIWNAFDCKLTCTQLSTHVQMFFIRFFIQVKFWLKAYNIYKSWSFEN